MCRDTDCLSHRSYGPIRVFFFFFFEPLLTGNQKTSLASVVFLFVCLFSVALPVQALRGLRCLGFFSVVQHVRHIEGPPGLGSYFVVQHIRHFKGAPWVGSYSVVP